MGGHSSHSSPFPNGVNSSSNALAPVNSTVVHSQNTAAVGLFPAASFKQFVFELPC